MAPMGVGELVSRARTAADLTQRELADRAGIDPGSISRIERGRYDPSWSMVERIANAMGLTVAQFAAGKLPRRRK